MSWYCLKYPEYKKFALYFDLLGARLPNLVQLGRRTFNDVKMSFHALVWNGDCN